MRSAVEEVRISECMSCYLHTKKQFEHILTPHKTTHWTTAVKLMNFFLNRHLHTFSEEKKKLNFFSSTNFPAIDFYYTSTGGTVCTQINQKEGIHSGLLIS